MNTNKYNLDITKYLDSAKRPNIAITNKQWFKESTDYELILQETEWVNLKNPELSVNARMLLIRDNITEFKKCIHCSSSIKFNNTISKTANFCSKSCARRHNNDKQIQTTKDKTEELYKTSSILSKEDLKYKLLKLKEKNINVCYSFVVLNRAGLAKSLDYYIVEDLELSVKANMFINDEFELNACKNSECINKVKHNKHYYCSVSCQSTDLYSTRTNTYFNKTGFLHPHYNPDVIMSRKLKSIIKWNYIVPQLSPAVMRKSKETKLQKYGDENFNNQEQREITNLQKYGFKCSLQNQEVKVKSENTMMKLYGVKHYAQTGLDISSGYKWKKYTLPSGKIIPYQGYEDKLLDELLIEYTEDDIKSLREDIPPIWYIGLDGKTRRYFPDVYIPKTNTIYEVKSEYTLNADYETNMLKFEAVKNAGYNFVLKVY